MIVIDGNDGTGKSTLVAALRAQGFTVSDRGLPTKLTVEEQGERHPNDVYIILEAPIDVSRSRLAQAGKDLNEKWHTIDSLKYFQGKFREVGAALGAIFIDSSGSVEDTRARVLQALRIPNRTIRLGVPKGRLLSGTMEYLNSLDNWLPTAYAEAVGARKLAFDGPFGLACTLLKPRAIPELVALGAIDAGITGEDLFRESVYEDNLTFVPLDDAKDIQICVLAPMGWSERNLPRRPLTIATEFPRLTSQWAASKGFAHIIVHSYGSTEAYVPKFTDLAVDVVETGQTADANGLKIIETLTTSRPGIVFRKGSGFSHHRMVLQ